jgi:ABC-2 type transport system ATP-binding protein
MIEIKNLSKKYEENTVLDIPELHIPKGQSFGLVGNNGAGKTTLFSLLLDLISPTTGFVLNNTIQIDLSEDWKSFTSAFIDDSFLIGYLTPEEYFQFIGSLRGWDHTKVEHFLEDFIEFFNDEILSQKKYIRDLSKGNAKKVGIVAALIGDPEIIILDEPFANLDPTSQIRLKKILKRLAESEEITILISSHDLSHTLEVTERIVVLNKGQVVKDLENHAEALKELEEFFGV